MKRRTLLVSCCTLVILCYNRGSTEDKCQRRCSTARYEPICVRKGNGERNTLYNYCFFSIAQCLESDLRFVKNAPCRRLKLPPKKRMFNGEKRKVIKPCNIYLSRNSLCGVNNFA